MLQVTLGEAEPTKYASFKSLSSFIHVLIEWRASSLGFVLYTASYREKGIRIVILERRDKYIGCNVRKHSPCIKEFEDVAMVTNNRLGIFTEDNCVSVHGVMEGGNA